MMHELNFKRAGTNSLRTEKGVGDKVKLKAATFSMVDGGWEDDRCFQARLTQMLKNLMVVMKHVFGGRRLDHSKR